ncbi:MAG TPA: L,D-transpeptidase family protein, partial [Sediminibacterium sp.]|nr:L,D-transpeptidase family protein [Sediminibacterium sp.]
DLLKKTGKHFSMNEAALQLELHLTGQFFRYAAKVYRGSDLDVKELGWFIPRKKIDLTALLDSSLKTGVTAADSAYSPLNRQYQRLQKALAEYISRQKEENKDTIPYITQLLRKNHSYAVIPAIKARLAVLGDLATADSTNTYDSTLFNAVRHFQHRMGLLEDGVIGNRVIEAMNVPIAERIRQILINLERIRWMPAEKDNNYILVNIPEYKMHVFDSGKQVFEMNVIVGTAANNTVIFTGNLKYIVFSPYWNVPESIVRKEVMPGIQHDKNYISRNHMEITGYSGKIPIVRQKPGPANSLGLVKFLFPNNYNIYFHDTPNRELFSQSSRSFSHGCIRLGEPRKLAAYLLRNDSAWNDRSIDSAMHLSKEKWVSLAKSIPVFIVYFTAWVDGDGNPNFRKDIYGHDARMAEKLFRH